MLAPSATPAAAPMRKYDKGERRFKHVGRSDEPEIRFSPGNPKMWVGKCPRTLSAADHVRLVNEALPGDNGDREIDVPKRLYVVHEGAIYEAITTDRGYSYHGYPYRGKLAGGLIDALRAQAAAKECVDRFDAWVKEHIEVHGSWA